MLPFDPESDDYRFYKSLNEDIQLLPDQWNQWDMQFENGDVVNVTGHDSLHNAICIAIMTRFNELKHNKLYKDFGCHIHELIKQNKSNMVLYKIEIYVQEVLDKMRRVQKTNWIKVTDNPHSEWHRYNVEFSVTSINDEIIEGTVEI